MNARLCRFPMRLLAPVVLCVFAGCAPQPSAPPAAPPPPRAPVDLSQIKAELQDARAQLDATSNALNVLAKSSTTNVHANDDAFGAQYYKLQSKANTVRSRAYDLKSSASAHDSTMASDMEAARFAFSRYMSNLEQIRDFLGAAPSVSKLESMNDLLAASNAQAKELQGRLDAMAREIDDLASATGKSQE